MQNTLLAISRTISHKKNMILFLIPKSNSLLIYFPKTTWLLPSHCPQNLVTVNNRVLYRTWSLPTTKQYLIIANDSVVGNGWVLRTIESALPLPKLAHYSRQLANNLTSTKFYSYTKLNRCQQLSFESAELPPSWWNWVFCSIKSIWIGFVNWKQKGFLLFCKNCP